MSTIPLHMLTHASVKFAWLNSWLTLVFFLTFTPLLQRLLLLPSSPLFSFFALLWLVDLLQGNVSSPCLAWLWRSILASYVYGVESFECFFSIFFYFHLSFLSLLHHLPLFSCSWSGKEKYHYFFIFHKTSSSNLYAKK